MAAPLFGQVKEFDGEKEWSQYLERLDHFFEANKVADVDKRAILLTVICHSDYKLLRNLLAPAKPKDKTYTKLVGILKEHYNPKPSEMVQRFRFNSRFRQPGVSIYLYVGVTVSRRILQLWHST